MKSDVISGRLKRPLVSSLIKSIQRSPWEPLRHEGSEVIRSGHKIIRAKQELEELENYINYASFLVAGGIRDPELLYYWINKAQEATFSLEDEISLSEIWPNRNYKFYAVKSESNKRSLIKELTKIIKDCKERITTEKEHKSDMNPQPSETSPNMPAEVDDSEIMEQLSEISLFIRYSHPVTADKVLGMDSVTNELKRKLLKRHPPVLFVTGGQGSGKTTLMKIVYEDHDVKNQFPVRSWVDAAKLTDLADLLRKVLKVEGSDTELGADAINELKIMTEIHNIFKDKSYLVVLDNVRDTCALHTLKQVLKGCKGKIICLARKEDIHIAPENKVNIPSLQYDDAFKLFIRAAFPRFLDSRAEENATFLAALQWRADKYPSLGINASEVGPTLANYLEDALYRCGGNPWNIWTLGTLLKANPYKWERILSAMDNVLIDVKTETSSSKKDVKTEKGKGKQMEKCKQKGQEGSTSQSPLDPPPEKSDPPIQLEDAKLPPDIRRSFLYCLAFPETSRIPARKLVRLWIAEGFVQDRLLHRQEQEAESLLQKLIDKKLLVVKKKDFDGKVLECSVNENIRALASTMCELQKFCRFVPEKQHPPHQYSCPTLESQPWHLYISQLNQKSKMMGKDKRFSYTSTTLRNVQLLNQMSKMAGKDKKFISSSTPWNRCRMLAVHGDEGVEDALRMLCKHDPLRSLLYFGTGRMQRSKFDLSFKGRYSLLRTLDLQGASLAFLPPSIQCLVCLRYLGLRNTQLEDLPASLHRLNKLICLDIRDTRITSVDVFAFKQMRHLYLANSFRRQSVTSQGLGLLIDLRTLSGAAYTTALEEELSYLELLRKLSLKKVSPASSENICHAINNMEFLQSLTITCEEDQFNVSSLKTGKSLRKLKLGGDMGPLCDNRLSMMQSITYLYLWDSNLSDDPLLRLQGLQHLLLLSLHNAYKGRKLRSQNGYRKLKKLSIISIDNLMECTIGQGAMKNLEELVFAKCEKMSSPPEGIEHIRSLEVVYWAEMPPAFCNGLNTRLAGKSVRVEEKKMHFHRSTRAATEGSQTRAADPVTESSDEGSQDMAAEPVAVLVTEGIQTTVVKPVTARRSEIDAQDTTQEGVFGSCPYISTTIVKSCLKYSTQIVRHTLSMIWESATVNQTGPKSDDGTIKNNSDDGIASTAVPPPEPASTSKPGSNKLMAEDRKVHENDNCTKDGPAANLPETFTSNFQQKSKDDTNSKSSQNEVADDGNDSFLEPMSMSCRILHRWYTNRSNFETELPQNIMAEYKGEHFLHGDSWFVINFDDLHLLLQLKELDTSLLRCWTLYMMEEAARSHVPVGFLDPGSITESEIERDMNYVEDYIFDVLYHNQGQNYIVGAYNLGSRWHWLLIVIDLKRCTVVYMDSKNTDKEFLKPITTCLDRAFEMYVQAPEVTYDGMPKLSHHFGFPCQKQPPGNNHCGYYVCIFMQELIISMPPALEEQRWMVPQSALGLADLSNVREQLCNFIYRQIIKEDGVYHSSAGHTRNEFGAQNSSQVTESGDGSASGGR